MKTSNITRDEILELAELYGIEVDTNYDKVVVELEDGILIPLEFLIPSILGGDNKHDRYDN